VRILGALHTLVLCWLQRRRLANRCAATTLAIILTNTLVTCALFGIALGVLAAAGANCQRTRYTALFQRNGTKTRGGRKALVIGATVITAGGLLGLALALRQ